MISKRKLLMSILFFIVLVSSISVIAAADSNLTDAQTVNDEEIELVQANYDVPEDEKVELEQSDSNQKDLSEDNGQMPIGEEKHNTKIIAENVTTVPGEGIIVAKLTDESGNPLPDCNLTLHIIDTAINRNFKTNGSGEVYFDLERPVLQVGIYTGVIKFLGNENYTESTLNITIEVCRFDTNITAENLTFIYGESGILTILLTDFKGNPIDNATINMDISPIHEELKTNATGEANFDFGILDVGTYIGDLVFRDTNKYIGSSMALKVTIEKIPTVINASDVTYTYGEKKYLLVTLKDKYGNMIANETVVFKINGIPSDEKTDANGQAEFLINVAPGSYNATVSFAGNKTHQSNSSTVHIVVNEIKEKISINKYNFQSVYNEGKYITVTLKDESGKGVSNKQFAVLLNGKTKVYVTDAKGQIKLPISSLVPKTYNATITFLGDEKYEPISFGITLVIKKAKPYIFPSKKKFNVKTSVKKYKVTLKNNKNAVMKNSKVYLKVKGKTYVAKTNKKGQAIFKLKKLTKKGTYKAVITYKGNNCYNKVVKNAKIKVW